MAEKSEKQLVVGILAHVDSGKTTLSEAMLYRAGSIRKLGRVDHRDAFLDTDALEKARAGLFQPALDLLLLLKFLLGNIAFEKVEKAHRGPPYF